MAVVEQVIIKVDIKANIDKDLASIEARLKALEKRMSALDKAAGNAGKNVDNLTNSSKKLNDENDKADKKFKRLSKTLGSFERVLKQLVKMIFSFVKTLAKISFIALAAEVALFSAALLGVKAALVGGRALVQGYQYAMKGLSVAAASVAVGLSVAAAAMRQYQEAQLAPLMGGGPIGKASARTLNRSYSAQTRGLYGSEALGAVTGSLAAAGVRRGDAVASQLFNISGGDAKAAQTLASAIADAKKSGNTGDLIKALSTAGGFKEGSISSGASLESIISLVATGEATSEAYSDLANDMASTFIGSIKTQFESIKGMFATTGEMMLGPFQSAFLEIARIIKSDLLSVFSVIGEFGSGSLAPSLVSFADAVSEFVRSNIVKHVSDIAGTAEKIKDFFGKMGDWYKRTKDWFKSYEAAANVVWDMIKAVFSSSENGLFRSFADQIVESRDDFIAIGTKIGEVLTSLKSAFAAGNAGFFSSLQRLSALLTVIANDVIPNVARVMATLAPLFDKVPEALSILSNRLGPMLANIGAAFEPLFDNLPTIVSGLMNVVSVLEPLVVGLAGVAGALSEVLDLLGPLGDTLAGLLTILVAGGAMSFASNAKNAGGFLPYMLFGSGKSGKGGKGGSSNQMGGLLGVLMGSSILEAAAGSGSGDGKKPGIEVETEVTAELEGMDDLANKIEELKPPPDPFKAPGAGEPPPQLLSAGQSGPPPDPFKQPTGSTTTPSGLILPAGVDPTPGGTPGGTSGGTPGVPRTVVFDPADDPFAPSSAKAGGKGRIRASLRNRNVGMKALGAVGIGVAAYGGYASTAEEGLSAGGAIGTMGGAMMAGAAFGPYGIAAGAIVGGISLALGHFSHKKKLREAANGLVDAVVEGVRASFEGGEVKNGFTELERQSVDAIVEAGEAAQKSLARGGGKRNESVENLFNTLQQSGFLEGTEFQGKEFDQIDIDVFNSKIDEMLRENKAAQREDANRIEGLNSAMKKAADSIGISVADLGTFLDEVGVKFDHAAEMSLEGIKTLHKIYNTGDIDLTQTFMPDMESSTLYLGEVEAEAKAALNNMLDAVRAGEATSAVFEDYLNAGVAAEVAMGTDPALAAAGVLGTIIQRQRKGEFGDADVVGTFGVEGLLENNLIQVAEGLDYPLEVLQGLIYSSIDGFAPVAASATTALNRMDVARTHLFNVVKSDDPASYLDRNQMDKILDSGDFTTIMRDTILEAEGGRAFLEQLLNKGGDNDLTELFGGSGGFDRATSRLVFENLGQLPGVAQQIFAQATAEDPDTGRPVLEVEDIVDNVRTPVGDLAVEINALGQIIGNLPFIIIDGQVIDRGDSRTLAVSIATR